MSAVEAVTARRRHPAMAVVVALVLGAGLLAVPPLVNVPYITAVFISVVIFGVLAAIYDFMIGYAGLSNFGFAGFLAVGAYTSALGAFHYGISPWYGLALGGLATAFLGLVTGLITLRLKGLYLGLTTWFIGETVRFVIANTPDYTRGVLGLSVDPFPDVLGIDFSHGGGILSYYYLVVLLGAAIMLAMTAVVRSRIGLAFKALREDELASESLGLNATRYKLLNFTLASLLIGVVGAFYATYLGILTPSPEEFGVARTVEILTITYVGGRGTLWGSLPAAFLLIGFEEYFRGLGPYRLVLFGVLLIFIMLAAPKGLAGLRKYFR